MPHTSLHNQVARTSTPEHLFCVAPMMDWTDRHDRMFLRLFTRRALLYTEMVTSSALKHGDAGYLLHYDPAEHPVALQLGGSNPEELAAATEMGNKAGYAEINLNVGCPSPRVQSGAFGACLMTDPTLVARCIEAMGAVSEVPVTVKCRIGVDDLDSDQHLMRFVDTVANAGCDLFVIHARIAILEGLSPKENREIPPLNYERVFRVKERFPDLKIVINGGISTLQQTRAMLQHVDGIMMGREAYQNPYILHNIDSELFGEQVCSKTRIEYLLDYIPYMERELAQGSPLHHMTRHVLGLFKGQKGGKQFRRHLSMHAHRKDAGINVLCDAINFVS